MQEAPIYQFKVVLSGSVPLIWRRFQIHASHYFYDFHEIVQVLMGWEDIHTFQFVVNDVTLTESDLIDDLDGEDSHSCRIYDHIYTSGQQCRYIYDLRDKWQHIITLEDIILSTEPLDYPRCIAGENSCPPENCAGIVGYNDLLDILADADHLEHAELKAWVGSDFAPTKFDKVMVNEELVELVNGWDD